MKYVRDWDNKEFETKEEAYEDCLEFMDLSDYVERLDTYVTIDNLLEWCFNQPSFYDNFGNEIYEIEQAFFEANYSEVDDNDDVPWVE